MGDLVQICPATSADAELTAVLAALPATGGTLSIASGSLSFSVDHIVSLLVNLRIGAGTSITIAGGHTLTINGTFEAPPTAIFALTGSVKFGGYSQREVYPQWWGAVADGSGYADDGAAINAAIASLPTAGPVLGGIVFFPSGDYFCSTGLVHQSYVVLQGANRATKLYAGGAVATLLTIPDGATYPAVKGFTLDGGTIASAIAIKGAGAGADNIELSSIVITGVPSGKFAIDIEWLIHANFWDLQMNDVGNGIRWQNLRAASAGGNSLLEKVYVKLLNGVAGTAYAFGSNSAAYSIMQSISASRVQAGGDGTPGQIGLSLENIGSSVFHGVNLESLDYAIDFLEQAQHIQVQGGYLGSIVTRGIRFNAAAWLNRIAGPLRISGTNAGGAIGVEDLNTTVGNPNYLEKLDVLNFPTKYSPAAETVFLNVVDYITQAAVLSPAFAIDGVAIVTVTIPHGLSYTPTVRQCQLSVVENTAVDDWAYGFLKVVSADATNVVVKVKVTIASGTAGAKAQLALLVQRI